MLGSKGISVKERVIYAFVGLKKFKRKPLDEIYRSARENIASQEAAYHS